MCSLNRYLTIKSVFGSIFLLLFAINEVAVAAASFTLITLITKNLKL